VETISQKVQRAETDLNGARDALSAHLADDNADSEATEQLSAAVEAYERHLTSMKRAEKALAARAGSEEPPATEQILVPAIRRPLGIKMREPKPHELIYRAAACALQAYVTSKDPIKVLEERYGDHEATQIVTRAAVDPAKTSVAGWAQELVEEATTDFLATLRPISIFPRLAELGQPLTFGPGRASIRVPSRATTPSISGSFVAEGAPIPVRRLGLTSITLSPHKLGVISVFTREMARYSNPQIEGLLRQEINADTAITIDTLLLDATAGSTTRPAGLTFGISAITPSAAGGYAAILADINALAAPFDAANAGRRLVLIMNPREARALNMAPGPDGTFGWAAGFMSEFTVLTSTTVTPGRLVMIDAADLVTVNGTPEFDVSEQTVLHMEDTTPLNIGTPGAPATIAAPAQSMFQTASLALRMLLDTTWAMRRAGMVQYMTGASWAPAP
jgi:HK97 family phage major capsid protein